MPKTIKGHAKDNAKGHAARGGPTKSKNNILLPNSLKGS
jgi:hypothetical protein